MPLSFHRKQSLKLAASELVSVPLSFHRKRSPKLAASELVSVPLGFHRKRSLKLAASGLVSVPLSEVVIACISVPRKQQWSKLNFTFVG